MVARRLPTKDEACSLAIDMLTEMKKNNNSIISANQLNYLLERHMQKNYDAVLAFLEDGKYEDVKTAVYMYKNSEHDFYEFDLGWMHCSANMPRALS